MNATLTHDSYLTSPRGWKSWALTLDHKRIGIMYLCVFMVMFLIGGIFGLLVRTELVKPTNWLLSNQQYNEAFTIHGVVMIFLFVIPVIPSALGNFFIPLLIGARDVAFPRLNLLSFWIYVFGVCVVMASLARPVDTGWTFYTPYSARTAAAVTVLAGGMFMVGMSTILTGLNFIVTIHRLRAPGMTWFRLPLFIWGIYATSIINVLATPVIGITFILLAAERTLGIGIFDPAKGGDPLLFQHFFWFYSHPVVYVMILPAMGIVSEVIPVFARKPIFGYRAIAYSSLAIAFAGFLVWGHHMFVAGMSNIADIVFSFLTFSVAIPTGVKIFNWIATLYKGSIHLDPPMIFALTFIFLFIIGGLTGMFLGALGADVHVHETYFLVAHFHYTIMGGTIMGLMAGLHYWYPKMTGRMLSERLAKVGWLLTFVGFNVTFFNMFILGYRGMPRRYATYPAQFQSQHIISTVGAFVLAAGIGVLVYNLLVSLRKGAVAPANPWRALTLEWQVPSPPPTENFEEIPFVKDWPYEYRASKTTGETSG